jgi:hypothetical protein
MKVRAVAGALLLCLIGVAGCVQPVEAQTADGAASRLIAAIAGNNTAAMRAAIEAGADVNANTGEGRSPLIAAAMFSKPEAVKVLLEKGADPNKTAEDPAIGNALTAAFFAMNGMELTGRSDEPDARKHAAALEVLRLIAAKKPNFDLQVRRGTTTMTALMIAAQAGALDAVQILLDAGANPNAANGGKFTALDYAKERSPAWSKATPIERETIVKALQAAGGKAKS